MFELNMSILVSTSFDSMSRHIVRAFKVLFLSLVNFTARPLSPPLSLKMSNLLFVSNFDKFSPNVSTLVLVANLVPMSVRWSWLQT